MNQKSIDLNRVMIKKELPKSQRIYAYIKDISNPYCFMCNGITIKLEFIDEDITLEESLTNFLISKK